MAKNIGDRLNDGDFEEYFKARHFMQTALDEATMMGLDVVRKEDWASIHSKYLLACQLETQNEVLFELVGVLQNISSKLSELHFKSD